MSKTILLFPGQGAQFVGMGKAIAETYAPAKEILEKADHILGFSLSSLMFEGPEDSLKSTDNTQPALFTHSMMVMAALREEGIPFDMVAGHSLGEYSAICAAGGFSFEEGLKLVRTRGELMASAGSRNPGSMAAVMGQDESQIEALCAEASAAGVVVPANFNCPGQIVVSGSVAGVARLVEICAERGIKAVPLAVSGAFHSELMEFAKPGLAEAVAKTAFKDLSVPLIANVTAKPVTSGKEIAELLVKQLVSPVRWNQAMDFAIAEGVTQGIEVGPGKVLMGLARKISRDLKVTSVDTLEAVKALKGA
ncbi:MAG: ACP S-malonyltransferase [Fibrobacter sp.]|jgi:[acyl-carrier-protein] S-malonyltransferase|nr:ACP S-malonyltransferase [Fibrobacter sp.]